jgi:uncharacterized protein YegP (UPF0339 family)
MKLPVTGYYEIYRSGIQWRWRFRARNHKVIADGEAYRNKADCLAAIELLRASGDALIREK